MNDRDKIILQKIAKRIKSTISFSDGINYNDFVSDERTTSATAFMLGQIGELVKEISDLTQESNPDIPWKTMRGMRNRIVHDYENIDLNVVWRTVTESLPELLTKINSLISLLDEI
ncbi:MAG: DUF86 domain-containing protein [Oscillospiraceae bacterium]|nr:DUF86 domain-containing protein [Oscillospiraceae bacterium]